MYFICAHPLIPISSYNSKQLYHPHAINTLAFMYNALLILLWVRYSRASFSFSYCGWKGAILIPLLLHMKASNFYPIVLIQIPTARKFYCTFPFLTVFHHLWNVLGQLVSFTLIWAAPTRFFLGTWHRVYWQLISFPLNILSTNIPPLFSKLVVIFRAANTN